MSAPLWSAVLVAVALLRSGRANDAREVLEDVLRYSGTTPESRPLTQEPVEVPTPVWMRRPT
jgi:predicted acyltransferase (DUF342 family)